MFFYFDFQEFYEYIYNNSQLSINLELYKFKNLLYFILKYDEDNISFNNSKLFFNFLNDPDFKEYERIKFKHKLKNF